MNFFRPAHNRAMQAGYTVIDLFVIMSGGITASIVAGYFDERWRNWIVYPGILVFGVAHWCLIFLCALPLVQRLTTRRPKDK